MSPPATAPEDPPVPGDPPVEGKPFSGTPQIEQTGCTEDQVAAQQGLCDAEFAQENPVYTGFKAQSDTQRHSVYTHNLAVSGYEQHLAAYESALADFEAALADYMNELSGRTYTTTALNDEADQLDAVRAALSAQRDQVMAEFTQLQDEADGERADMDSLRSDIQGLIQALADFLKTLKCGVTCGKVSALLARAQLLLAASSFSVRDPSAQPSIIPMVPRLPSPPQPPSGGVAPPPRRKPPKTTVTLAPGFNGKPELIQAGEIWPKIVPLEGAVRLCIGAIFWEWAEVPRGAKITAKTPGVRPAMSGAYGVFQYKFQPGSQPVISVAGGLPVSDVQVSSNGTCVFFTLHDPALSATPGTYDVSVRAADGTLIELRSPDPGTSLTYQEDAGLGLAGFQSGLALAVVSSFDAELASPSRNDDLLKRWESRISDYEEALLRLLQRSSGDAAAWAAKIDLTRAMFRPASLYDRDSGLWDLDADAGLLSGLWTDAQYDIFERESFLSAATGYWPPSANSDRVQQVLQMSPLRRRFSPPVAGPYDILPEGVDV